MGVQVVDIAKILGGAKALNRDIRAISELREAVEGGLPVAAMKNAMSTVVSKTSRHDQDAFASVVFQSLARRKIMAEAGGKLNAPESERTERIARIFALAERALGDARTARKFMVTPNLRLGGVEPLLRLKSEVGALEVEELLNAVMYGLPS